MSGSSRLVMQDTKTHQLFAQAFLARAREDLVHLEEDLRSRITYQGTIGHMVETLRSAIQEAETKQHDEDLRIHYRNFRGIASANGWWMRNVHDILNATLGDRSLPFRMRPIPPQALQEENNRLTTRNLELEQKQQQHNLALSELKCQHQTALQTARDEEKRHVEQVREEGEIKSAASINLILLKMDQCIDKINQDNKNNIQQINEQHIKKIEEINKQHNTKIEQIIEHHDQRIEKMAQDHKKDIEKIIREKDEVITGLRTTVQQKEDIIAGLEKSLKDKDEEIASLKRTGGEGSQEKEPVKAAGYSPSFYNS